MSAVKPDQRGQLELLVPRFQADLWRYLRFLGAAPGEADDLVQETFLAILRSGFQYRTECEAFTYLRTTARRQLLALRRQQGRSQESQGLEAAEQVWAEMQDTWGGWDEYLVALDDCLSHLEGRAREVIELYYRQRCDQSETGRRLGMEREGVKTLLRRVRQRLRQCIERKVKA